jgi:hypothetical protein
MASILLSNESNPDVSTTQYKLPVDIMFNSADITASAQASVSASGQDYTQFIKVSNDGETINVVVGDPTVNDTGTIYYTPLYSEKINYQEWQSKINKNFLELS